MTDWIDINDELPPLQKFVIVTDAATNTDTAGLVTIARRICHTPSNESETDSEIPQTAPNPSYQKMLEPLIELSQPKIARTLS